MPPLGNPEPLNVEDLGDRQPPTVNIAGGAMEAAQVGSPDPGGDASQLPEVLDKVDDAFASQDGVRKNTPHAHIDMLATGPIAAGGPLPQEIRTETLRSLDELFSTPGSTDDPRLDAAAKALADAAAEDEAAGLPATATEI